MSYVRSPSQSSPVVSLDATTSTGPGAAYGVPPTQLVATQVTRASTAAVATTVTVQGSIDGTNWFALGAQQSYTSTGSSVYVSTGTYLVSHVRANIGAHTATGPVTATILTA